MGQNVRGAKSPDTLRRLDDKNERLGLGLATHIRIFNNGTIKIKLGHTDASRAQWIDCGKLLSLGSNKPGKQTVHRLKCRLEKCHKDIYLYTSCMAWGKWNPVNKDHLDDVGGALYGWLGDWMYLKTLILSGDFRFRISSEYVCPFSFSFRFRP